MSPLIGIPLALLGLGLIIAVHEAGHAVVARLCRIGVREFAIGFGPTLLSRRLGATDVRLRAIPFGGFVRIAGDDDDAAAPDAFGRASLPARIAVIGAGVVANVVIAALLVGVVSGPLVPSGAIVIEQVNANSPAAAAGMRTGEAIIAIEGTPVDLIAASEELSLAVADGRAALTVAAVDGTTRVIDLRGARPPGDPRGQLGVAARVEGTGGTSSRPLERWLPVAAERVPRLMGAVVSGYLALPGMLLTPSPAGPPLSGPAGITATIADSAATGGVPLFLLTIALISANIAVLNLLPIPPIDGGRMVGLIGATIAPGVARRVGRKITIAGVIALLALAAVATLFDLLRVLE